MARNQIKLGADVSSIKRSIIDLSRTLDQTLSQGKSVKIFDDKTVQFMKEGSKQALNGLQEQMQKLTEEADRYKNEIAAANNNDQEAMRLKKELLRIETERARTQKEITDLQDAQQNIERSQSGGLRGGFYNAGRQLQQIPGLGGLGRMMSGGGGMLMRLAPLMAVGFAALRGRQAFNAYRQDEGGLETSLGLRARRVNPVFGFQARGFNQLGFSAREAREAQRQSIDIFGRAGSTSDAVMRRAEFARGTGINLQQLQGSFGALRPMTNMERVNRAFEEFRAQVLAKGIEEQLEPYLNSAVELLSAINQDGLGLNNEAMAALFAVAQQNNMAPEQAARLIGGLDQAVRGSSGANQAFFMEAFGRQGIGSGILGGTMEATRQGIFGGNMDVLRQQLNPEDLQALQAFNIVGENMSDQKITGILDALESAVQRSGAANLGENQQRFVRGGIAAEAFGLPSVVEGMRAIRMMEQIQGARTSEEEVAARRELEQFMDDPTGEKAFREKITEIFNTTEGQLVTLNKTAQDIHEQIAKNVAPALIPLSRAVQMLEELLTLSPNSRIANFLGGGLFNIFGAFGGNDNSGSVNLPRPNIPEISREQIEEMTQQQRQEFRERLQNNIRNFRDQTDMSLEEFARRRGANVDQMSSSDLQGQYGAEFERISRYNQESIEMMRQQLEVFNQTLSEMRMMNKELRKPKNTNNIGSRR